MFKHPVFLTLAAICCGAPATIVAAVMLPWAIVATIAGMPTQPMLATFNLLLVIAAPYALGSYWLLAARTIKGRTFKRGWSFWTACAAALFTIVAVFDALPVVAAAAVAGPIILATAVCLQTQRAISVEMRLNLLLQRTASPPAERERWAAGLHCHMPRLKAGSTS